MESSIVQWIFLASMIILLDQSLVEGQDLLQFFQPKETNSEELNAFLKKVQQHSRDFNFLKDAAEKFQSYKLFERDSKSEINNAHQNNYQDPKIEPPSYSRDSSWKSKRFIHSKATNVNSQKRRRRIQEIDPKVKKHQKERYQRNLEINNSENDAQNERQGYMPSVPREKKEGLDFSSDVLHKAATHAHLSNQQRVQINPQKDDRMDRAMWYLDENGQEKHSSQQQQEQQQQQQQQQQMQQRQIENRFEYMNQEPNKYEMDEPSIRQKNDNFEEAETYQVIRTGLGHPINHNQNPNRPNDPRGNNLYALDSGGPFSLTNNGNRQTFQKQKYELMQQKPITHFEYIPQSREYVHRQNIMQNPKITMNGNKKMSPEEAESLRAYQESSLIKSSRNGGRRPEPKQWQGGEHQNYIRERHEDQNEENEMNEKNLNQGVMLQNIQEPLIPEKRESKDNDPNLFLSRKLQFVDDTMVNINDHMMYDDETIPREKRNFLDKLGMKDFEDYSGDNPFVGDDLIVNNTAVANDTHIMNHLHKCNSTIDYVTPTCPKEVTQSMKLKGDMNNMKKVLEEPVHMTGENTISEAFKTEEKREKKTDNIKNIEKNEKRVSRGLGIGHKILMNKIRLSDRSTNEKFNSNYDDGNESKLDAFKITDKEYREKVEKKLYDEPAKCNIDTILEELAKNSTIAEFTFDITTESTIEITEETTEKTIEETTEENTTEQITTEQITTEQITLETARTTNDTKQSVGNNTLCDKESFRKTQKDIDDENAEYMKLAKGQVASKIVSLIHDELRTKTCFKSKFYSGMSKKHLNFNPSQLNVNIQNDTSQNPEETKIMMEDLTKSLNHLVELEVRRKLCQRLPDTLKDFLNIITDLNAEPPPDNSIPNTDQGDFLFSKGDNVEKNGGDNKSTMDIGQLQSALKSLQELLVNYQKLKPPAKNQAKPIKDFIDHHVNMAQDMINSCKKKTDVKRNAESNPNNLVYDRFDNDNLIEKQLESVGLGKKQIFVPAVDISKIVKTKMDLGANFDKRKRNLGYNKISEKYKKLQNSVEERRRRSQLKWKMANNYE